MILILNSDTGDFSHIEIINWLEFYNADYLVLTGESLMRGNVKFEYTIDDIFLNGISLKNISVVLYRRWQYPYQFQISKDKILNEAIVSNLFNESIEIRNLLFEELKDAVWFPSPKRVAINKLLMLKEAKRVGLRVPDTIVTTEKKQLIRFVKSHNNRVITKAIGNYLPVTSSDGTTFNPIFTKIINIDDIRASTASTFSNSLFQEYLPKAFELRIFYFNNKFFSTALMSQHNEITQIDSRVTENLRGSKLVPYKLPRNIEKQLISFLKNVELNTGSIDMIVTPDGDFYFLEINPVGQIAGYSRRTGQCMERFIAEQLIKIDERVR